MRSTADYIFLRRWGVPMALAASKRRAFTSARDQGNLLGIKELSSNAIACSRIEVTS